jgi:TonB family protein
VKRLFFILYILFVACGTGRFRSPKVISEMQLEYPLTAQMQRIEGDVLVGVFVGKDGKSQQTKLLESSGHTELDEAALVFAEKINFEPASIDEKPVGSWTKLILRYRLDKVYFEKEKWLNQILDLQSQADAEKDSTKLEGIYRKLYIYFAGLVEYIKVHDTPEINRTIQHVLSRPVYARWQPVWDLVAAPFAVYDDFLSRYPSSTYKNKMEEELVRLLVEAEYKIRVNAIKSARINRKSTELVNILEKRVQEIQKTVE